MDSIWIVVDRITKTAQFVPVRTSYSVDKLARLYVSDVVQLHGVPLSITSDMGAQFISAFWKSFQKAFESNIDLSSGFHPQSYGQSEQVVWVLEDMLRACVLDFQANWKSHIPLAEFAYNNSYLASTGMAPFEALYGRPCISPICWAEVGENSLVGRRVVAETTENIRIIRGRLREAQSRQKSYADHSCRPLHFEVGQNLLLRVSPKKGLGLKGKLAPRFIGPFQIIEKIGEIGSCCN
ncbi:hypothetical protein MKW98_007760 [Papaver atlanticum]|uniref:Integrase catalytic domain-containing protein n=1 Tax=Papaver atlanticum TaxID=357466 RepID=A0AAD4X4E9_9MAGN|nr:hypothetical protein MKW98_007760 [Papaver atlanticum]